MDKKTLIAMVLIGLILLGWPYYMKYIVKQDTTEQTDGMDQEGEESSIAEAEGEEGEGGQADQGRGQAGDKSGREEGIEGEGRKRDTTVVVPETFVEVNTDRIYGKLSSLEGGTIVSWKLKKYMGIKDDQGLREPVEMIPLFPDSNWRNLGIVLGGQGGDTLLRKNFHLIENSIQVDQGDSSQKIVFSSPIAEGGEVIKEFIIPYHSYHFQMTVRFSGISPHRLGSSYRMLWESGINPTEASIRSENPYYQAYALQNEKVKKTKMDEVDNSTTTDWTVIRNKYFVTAVIPRTVKADGIQMEGKPLNIYYTPKEVEPDRWKRFDVQLKMPYKEAPHTYTVYMGPIDYRELKGLDVGVEKIMNFGWAIIRPFSIAFYFTLEFLYGLLRNYGLAIILFSILIKVVLYPLTRKSYQSMHKMQALQPKLKSLQEKFKGEPQRLNEETMKLYKQAGVNPLGGCLPLLLQMPVLFALFSLFRTTIMLRQAGFLGIQDLSAPDSLLMGINIMPIIMGVTMIIQQRLSSQQTTQKAMTYFMPVFMIFIFYNLSAGLNLYYLMFNLLTIAQELFIKRRKS
jgi:YidC/Oxa1 family membrane protein insertase